MGLRVAFFDTRVFEREDDVLVRLLTFPNVLITSHQAFLTHEALARIADVTLENITSFERGALANRVRAEEVLVRSASGE